MTTPERTENPPALASMDKSEESPENQGAKLLRGRCEVRQVLR
jgi:hypothetical protein